MGVFAEEGDAAAVSSDYRFDLIALLPDISLLGLSPAAHVNPAGVLFFSGFYYSIDSALIYLGLTYGMLAMIVAVVLFLTAVWPVLRGRATAPTIAVVALLPGLLTVALITQYAMFFWFCAGLAVTSQTLRTKDPSPSSALSHRRGGPPLRLEPKERKVPARRGV
jgi:hypothetical protein